MTPQRRSLLGGALGVAAVLLLHLQGSNSQMHTQMDVFNDSCDAQLQYLWGNYTSPPVAPVAGCNKTCLAACYDIVHMAIYSEKKQHCPVQADIIRCMHVYRAQWLKFVKDCALFQYGTSGSAESPSESGSSGSSSAASTAGAPGAPPSSAEGGVTPSPPAAPAEGGASPSTPAEAAAAGRRRRLLQDAEGALSKGSSGSGSGGNSTNSTDVTNGCFPTFDTVTQFEQYLNGEYVFPSDSAAAGITLSVLFYVSLLLLGTGLPKFIKRPLAQAKARLNCFKRKPQKLSPPLQQQHDNAAGVDAVAQTGLDAAPLAP